MTHHTTHTHTKPGPLRRIRIAIRSIGASDGLGGTNPWRSHTERSRQLPTIPIQ